MPLGPQTKAFFQKLAELAKASTAVALDSIPIVELRKANRDAFKEYTEALPPGVSEADFQTANIELKSFPAVPIVTYTPPGYDASVNPTAIFLYGSGFVIDILPAHFSGIAKFARESTTKVIAVDYPLAPECKSDKLPAIAFQVVEYIVEHGKHFDINPDNFNLIGYSAGGNLAAGIIYQNIINDKKLPINRLMVINPWLDLSCEIHRDNPFLEDQNLDEMLKNEVLEYLASLYISSGDDPKFPLISPLFIENVVLSQFPATYILSAQYDRLRGTAHAFKERLEKVGVDVTEKVFEGQTHNCFIARNVMADGEDPADYLGEVLNSTMAPQCRM